MVNIKLSRKRMWSVDEWNAYEAWCERLSGRCYVFWFKPREGFSHGTTNILVPSSVLTGEQNG